MASTRATVYLVPGKARWAEGVTLPPPLLGARVKLGAVMRLLGPSPGDRILDLGCGGGKFSAWIASRGLAVVGVDVAANFLPEAASLARLVRADLARLPIASASMDGAVCVDVLEHLPPATIESALEEAHRVLGPGARLVVYTHTRDRSPLAVVTLPARRLIEWLMRRGLLGDDWDRERKLDHVNAIETHEQFDEIAKRGGFEVTRRIYYNPLIATVVEGLGLGLARAGLAAWARVKRKGPEVGTPGAAAETVPAEAAHREEGRRIAASKGLAYAILLSASSLVSLDLALFGRVRAGPFFAVLTKRERRP